MSKPPGQKRARGTQTPSATNRRKTVSRKIKMVSLSGAAAYFRVPGSGNPPSRGLLLYHLRTGALVPDKVTELPAQKVYGFTPATLRAFARVVGWQYVARGNAA